MASVIEYSLEELNYFRACYVTTRIIPNSLRIVFKREWDNRYQATPYGTWQDTAKNGTDFYNMESTKSKKKKAKELAVIKKGNTCKWDCTCLFYAILFSDSVGKGLDPAVKKSVDDLRLFRNDVAHIADGKLNESNFTSKIKKVITAFTSLNLSTAGIEDIKKQNTFPTAELRAIKEQLRDIKKQLEKEKMRNEEPQPFCVLPTKPSHQVIHRPHEIREIQAKMERLRSSKPNEITVIYLSGNPGCGKSEIARQVGEKVFEDASDHATETMFVFTLNASSHDTLIQSYVEFAIRLKCEENSVTSIVTSKDLSQEVKLIQLKCLATPKLRKYSSWLIIVDNVTDVKSVLRYLPQAGEKTEGKGQMLVTTQDSRSIAPDKSYAYHLSLSKGMERREAFRTLSEISGFEDEGETTFEIAKALDFQPLALACAATYMKRVHITIPTFTWEEYGEKLKQGKRETTEGEFKIISVAYSQPMTAAVRLAVEKEMADRVMKRAFHFLSVMAPEPIPMEYVVQYVTRLLPDEDEELVAAHISSSSLILSSGNQSKEISVHQVVYSCLQSLLLHQNRIEEYHFFINVIQAFSRLLNSFQENHVDHIVATKSIVVHFIEVSKKLRFYTKNPQLIPEKQIRIKNDQFIRCLSKMGNICQIHGKHETGHCFHKMSFMIKENTECCKNHPTSATTLNNLGLSYRDLGQHKEAQNCFERALAIEEKSYSQDHPTLATILNNLGVSYDDLGQHKEAQKCLERALAIEEKAYGADHPALATTFNNLGVNSLNLGQHKKAQICFERALAIQEKAYDPDHPGLAITMNNLGLNYRNLGQHKEARKCFERALAIQEKAYDADHLTLAITLSNLGASYSDLGQHKEGQKCFERALAIREKTYDPDHPDLATTLNNLGRSYSDLGQYKKAQKCLERALAIEEKAYGADHPALATTLNNLGRSYSDLDQYKEAQKCLERALAIQEKAYDQDHPNLANVLYHLGSIYCELGHHKKAQKYLERALAVDEKLYDADHPTLATTLKNLGLRYSDLGQHKAALKCLKRALSIEEKSYGGEDHPTLATTLNNLGNSYRNLGRHKEAKKCLKRALAIEEKSFGPDHPALATTLDNLGRSYWDLGRHKKALKCLEMKKRQSNSA